jgi:hypothetical protein
MVLIAIVLPWRYALHVRQSALLVGYDSMDSGMDEKMTNNTHIHSHIEKDGLSIDLPPHVPHVEPYEGK